MTQRYFQMTRNGDTLTLGFGKPADNNVILAELGAACRSFDFGNGPILKITGRASLPMIACVAHAVCHLYAAVAVFDPKLGGFVVAISHGTAPAVGTVVPA